MKELCLLLKTVDNRRFFTEVDNFPQLIEFSKSQNVEVSVVKPQEEIEVMALSQLAKCLCDPLYNVPDIKYDIIEKKILGKQQETKTVRQRILDQAKEIRRYIEEELLFGKVVSMYNVTEKFKSYGLGEPAIRKHLTYVRLKLAKTGIQVDKVAVGSYQKNFLLD